MTSALPAKSAMWRYRGTPFSAAPALHTARDTPRMAFAPNLARTEQVTLRDFLLTSLPPAGRPRLHHCVHRGLYSEPFPFYLLCNIDTRNAIAFHVGCFFPQRESPFFGPWDSGKFHKLLDYIKHEPLLSNPTCLLLSAGHAPDV